MEMQVKEIKAPIITTNFETVKKDLQEKLAEYTGLVVTDETLAGGKAAQKELASLRVQIDTYRKDIKKKLEQPIKHFEAQCKELIALVETVEKPIKEGIQVFDDKKREEKRQQALAIIAEVAAEHGLNEKYAAKLDVVDKYMNLTATAKAVRDDVDTRVFALKVEQDREQERLDILQSVIDSENSRLRTKIELEMWQRHIDNNVPTGHIIEQIKIYANKLYEAENKPVEPPKTEQPTEMPQQAETKQETPQAQPEKQYTATLKLVGSLQELRAVSAFIREHGISYTVLDQREA